MYGLGVPQTTEVCANCRSAGTSSRICDKVGVVLVRFSCEALTETHASLHTKQLSGFQCQTVLCCWSGPKRPRCKAFHTGWSSRNVYRNGAMRTESNGSGIRPLSERKAIQRFVIPFLVIRSISPKATERIMNQSIVEHMANAMCD